MKESDPKRRDNQCNSSRNYDTYGNEHITSIETEKYAQTLLTNNDSHATIRRDS